MVCIGWALIPAYAQQGDNLVLNGNFEQRSGCPFNNGNTAYCISWIPSVPNLGSPDYFHQCSLGNADVPQNLFGYQESSVSEDSAYIGFATFMTLFTGGQEIACGILSIPLQSGIKYRIRLKASMADSANYASCCVGVVLASTPPPPPPFTSNIANVELVIAESDYNTENWFQLDATYTAQGGEDKIYIGSFRPDSESNPILVRPDGSENFNSAYFYIDDVEVYVDDTVTDIAEETRQANVRIWFDATARTVVVKGAAANALVRVHDAMGRLVAIGSGNMDVSGLSGFYVVRVYDAQGHELEVQKVILF